MRLSYTEIKQQFLRNIGQAGSTDTQILADFNLHLQERYQLVMAKLANYMTQVPKTAVTEAQEQYYSYPLGVVNIESIVVTVGSIRYPLTPITSQRQWDVLNAIDIQPTTTPQFFFPRRDDFGVWPIPQDTYTMTFNHHMRDRSLQIEDYTAGSIACTNNSATVEGTTTAFTSSMVGLWLVVTDTSKDGWGYWYRIGGVTDADTLTLENVWQSGDISGATFRICQTPEIPEEGHMILIDGVTADYYAGLRGDLSSATWFNNKFWTGDGNNNSRVEGDQSIKSGLIGLVNQYADRNQEVLVQRNPQIGRLQDKAWSYTITT